MFTNYNGIILFCYNIFFSMDTNFQEICRRKALITDKLFGNLPTRSGIEISLGKIFILVYISHCGK